MKKKLLVIIPHVGNAGGGVSESARVLTDALFKKNIFDIHVLTIRTENDLKALAVWPAVNFYFYESLGPSNYGFSPGMIWHMLKNKYDVIHVHGVWTFHVFAAGLGLIKNTPIIISPHGMLEYWILRRSLHLKSAVMKLYQAKIFKEATFFHALTCKEEQDIKNLIPSANIKTIPNFVPEVDSNKEYPVWFKKEYEGKKIFLFFGRIHDKKGWRPLLNAWIRFNEKDKGAKKNCILVFCGWIDGIADFEIKIKEATKLTNNVIYAGPQYGVDRIKSYQAADFFILPSQSEGLPMAVLEAIKNDTLVMISKECNLPDLINISAAIDSGFEEDTILLSLNQAYSLNKEQYENMKQKSRHYVDSNFSEDYVVNSVVNIFQDAIYLKKAIK